MVRDYLLPKKLGGSHNREAKGWLGLREYQVRDQRSLIRHFLRVFCAYTFILWYKLTGVLRRRWANQPLNTFFEHFY